MNLKETGTKIWLDYLDYANRLFAAGRDDLLHNPSTYISVISQGQGLLKSDVIFIHMNDFYRSFIQSHSTVAESWVGKKPTFAIKKTLALEEPKQIVTEVLKGLQSLFYGSKPIVITIDSPKAWIQWLHQMVLPNEQLHFNADELEGVSVYLAEFLRNFSTFGVSAIVINEGKESYLDHMQLLSCCQPILNIAKHYQWLVGYHIEQPVSQNLGIKQISDKVDFTLFSASSIAEMLPHWESGFVSGGGLNKAFWTENGNPHEIPHGGLLFGKIPADAEPEKVLSRLNFLRS